MTDAEIFQPERDVGKARFQQELNRWFESRGIIADLRSHLRHLMISALQSNQVGAKPTDGSSPKAQAMNLMVAEYLFKRGCHYTLSVFTSEVPTLANFNLEDVLQGGKAAGRGDKPARLRRRFQETDVDEIFDALGMSSRVEELTLLKSRYLEKGNEASLLELFLPMAVRLATRLQVQQNLHSSPVQGKRLLSKEWSSKIVDILLGEKIPPSQVSAMEEAISRITEKETHKALEEERRSQMRILSEREKRIQEYLRKHEEEILNQLREAEKVLTARKETIEEELCERQEHLAKMAMEWKNKHEEILKLSKMFHGIENENRTNEKKLKELEKENKRLKAHEEMQTKTIRDMQEEMNSLMNKLRQITDSNGILHDRIQVLIDRESKELCANQKSVQHSEPWEEPAVAFPPSRGSDGSKREDGSLDDEDSLSSSLGDIIDQVQKKLQFLEGESDRLNQNYLEYKLKPISVESDSESLKSLPLESPPSVHCEAPAKETKFCQTVQDTFVQLQKQKKIPEGKCEFNGFSINKPQTCSTKFIVREPTKRQLQNREFFLDRRQLLQQIESLQIKDTQSSSTADSSGTDGSVEESAGSQKKPPPSPKSTSARSGKNPSVTDSAGMPAENRMEPKSIHECLALLEEARIDSPEAIARIPLRQQMLLCGSENEEPERRCNQDEGEIEDSSKSVREFLWPK